MYYFWWGCRGNLTLITLGSERVNGGIKPDFHWWIFMGRTVTECPSESRGAHAGVLVVFILQTRGAILAWVGIAAVNSCGSQIKDKQHELSNIPILLGINRKLPTWKGFLKRGRIFGLRCGYKYKTWNIEQKYKKIRISTYGNAHYVQHHTETLDHLFIFHAYKTGFLYSSRNNYYLFGKSQRKSGPGNTVPHFTQYGR